MEQIKLAYDLGINAFDTANVYSHGVSPTHTDVTDPTSLINALFPQKSEIILGEAIKKYNLPRDEIVVMTKACGTVRRDDGPPMWGVSQEDLHRMRYVNQQGLSRKVSCHLPK